MNERITFRLTEDGKRLPVNSLNGPRPSQLARLPPVPAPDEQLDGTPERVDALREAA